MALFIPPSDLLRSAAAGQQRSATSAQTGLTTLANQLVSDFDRRRFGRLEDQIIASGGQLTPEDVASVMGDADARAARSFDVARGVLERQEAGLGQSLDPAERASQERRLRLAEAAARVDARNRALGAERARRAAARSAAFGLEGQITDIGLGGLETAANMETQREVDYRRALAEHEQKRAGALGALAGIGLSFLPGGALLGGAIG